MRLLHVISSISRQSGGPSRSSQGLVAGLRKAGVDAWLMTLVHGEEPWIKGCDQFINGGAFEDALVQLKPDIVHLHCIWDLKIHRCAVICRRRKIPYVIAPRGMLEPWSLQQKWLKKRVARFLYQDWDLKKAAALHATAESEADQFRKLGFRNYVIVSPNGVNVPVAQSPSLESKSSGIHSSTSTLNFNSTDSNIQTFSHSSISSPRRALFVSRMHPKKGVLELVESWARVRQIGMVVPNRITANWYDVVSADEILGLPIVEVCPSTSRFADKRALKDLFKSFGQVENRSDGRRVTFPAKSVGKMMGQKGVDLYRIAASFADIFREARRAWSESEASIEDHKQHRNIDAYHQYIAKFTDGTDECFVRFTVREDKGGRSARNEIHSSTVSRIIVYKAKGEELSNLSHAQAEDSTPFVDNKISYFLNRVNPLAHWQCELVYTLNGDTERAYEAKVKQRITDLGMTYVEGKKIGQESRSTTDGSLSRGCNSPNCTSSPSRAFRRNAPTGGDESGALVEHALPEPTHHSSTSTLNFNSSHSNIQTFSHSNISSPDFILTGPLNDDDKWAAYARADLFILPTYSENFGIVVAEALWAGLPVITTKGTPWSELVSHSCGWWIDLPPVDAAASPRPWPALDAALREATHGALGDRALPLGSFNSSHSNIQTFSHSNISLQAMGANGHALVESKYTWPAVVKAMIHGYEQILRGAVNSRDCRLV